jgi:hypothetical protein
VDAISVRISTWFISLYHFKQNSLWVLLVFDEIRYNTKQEGEPLDVSLQEHIHTLYVSELAEMYGIATTPETE